MIITDSIAHDCDCVKLYFDKLFQVLNSDIPIDVTAHATDSAFNSWPPGYKHFIRPSMINNTYGLFDFWIKRICEHQKFIKGLPLAHSDLKGSSDLDTYYKYLSIYCGLSFDGFVELKTSVDELRIVRNTFVHNGGHARDNEIARLEKIKGITLLISLIEIKDEFVLQKHADVRKLLLACASQ